jgi:hypothetical protein
MRQRPGPACRLPVRNENQSAGSDDPPRAWHCPRRGLLRVDPRQQKRGVEPCSHDAAAIHRTASRESRSAADEAGGPCSHASCRLTIPLRVRPGERARGGRRGVRQPRISAGSAHHATICWQVRPLPNTIAVSGTTPCPAPVRAGAQESKSSRGPSIPPGRPKARGSPARFASSLASVDGKRSI